MNITESLARPVQVVVGMSTIKLKRTIRAYSLDKSKFSEWAPFFCFLAQMLAPTHHGQAREANSYYGGRTGRMEDDDEDETEEAWTEEEDDDARTDDERTEDDVDGTETIC